MIRMAKKSAVHKYAKKLLAGSGNEKRVIAPMRQTTIISVVCLSFFI